MSVITGQVINAAYCNEEAARCCCVKPLGHVAAGDPVHACDAERCGGQWTGTYPDGDFTVVALPIPSFLFGGGVW